MAINGGILAVLGFLLNRDLSQQARDRAVIQREEALGRLQIVAPGGRAVALAALRGNSRPLILAGSRGQVARAVAAAEPFYEAYRERGISLVPLVTSADDPDEKIRALKAELKAGGSGRGGGGEGEGEGEGEEGGAAAGASGRKKGPAPAQERRGFRNASATAGKGPSGPPVSSLNKKVRRGPGVVEPWGPAPSLGLSTACPAF